MRVFLWDSYVGSIPERGARSRDVVAFTSININRGHGWRMETTAARVPVIRLQVGGAGSGVKPRKGSTLRSSVNLPCSTKVRTARAVRGLELLAIRKSESG